MTAPLRVMVVDDENLAREELCFLLEQSGGTEIVGQASDGVQALKLCGELRPDLLFLDVQMPGLTGFEVARRLIDAEILLPLVFVTAFDQYAIDAFTVNAVDYLLKPVDPDRLDQTLDRVRQRLASVNAVERPGVSGVERPGVSGVERPGVSGVERPDVSVVGQISPADLDRLVEAVQARQGRRDQVAIRVGERFVLVQAQEISHASLVEETIVVVTNTTSGTSNYRTLDELQARLDPTVFWRVHRSHLVNITNIKEIVPWFSRNYILRMKDPKATEIPVSRSQTKRLRDYLQL